MRNYEIFKNFILKNKVSQLDKLSDEHVHDWLVNLLGFSVSNTEFALIYTKYIYSEEYIKISIQCSFDGKIFIKVENLSNGKCIIKQFFHIKGTSLICELGDCIIDAFDKLNIKY